MFCALHILGDLSTLSIIESGYDWPCCIRISEDILKQEMKRFHK